MRKMKNVLSKIRLFLLSASVPMQKILQKITPPERKGCADWYRKICTNLEAGDIFLTRENYHFTNLFIPGFYSHAAIYTGNKTVVEAVPEGVVETDLIDFVVKKDYICQVRPSSVTLLQRHLAGQGSLKLKGKPYDYLFFYKDEVKNEAFYCSEIPYFLYKDTTWAKKVFVPKQAMGIVTITPQDYRDAVNSGKLELISEFF